MTKDRLFIAIPVGKEQRSVLRQLQHALQSAIPFGKWVYPDDLHITLKFLGDTDADIAGQVMDKLKNTTAAARPFRLELMELGTFGKPSAPSILWMGIRGEMEALGAIQAEVEASVAPLGFAPEDRPFRPHITIARKYKGDAAFSGAMLQNSSAATGGTFVDTSGWTVDRVVLYRTHMGRQPMYEAVATFQLGG